MLAGHVLAYDLLPDGGIVHTNGSGISLPAPSSEGHGPVLGEPQRTARGAFVERVVVV